MNLVRSFLLLLLVCLSAGARAQEVSASASLTRNVAAVGEPIQLQILLNGTGDTAHPPNVAVDGLEINYTGPASQFRMENFTTIQRSVTHNYQVVPTRAGTFKIPSLDVTVEGKRLRTQPLMLTVQAAPPAAPAAPGGGGQLPLDKIGFAEIVLPKKTAYVGEAIPIELRLQVDDRVRWQLETMPQFEGDGFTKSKLTQPKQESAQRDGRLYNVVVVHTAITPSKAGKLSIGPLDFTFVAQVPRPQRKRQGSVFDMFDNMFDDPFFATNQRLNTKAQAVEIDVKPLPVEGRPPGFSGAVGEFKFTADGNPREVKVGDPVTMKLRVSGSGSFARVEAPAMTDRAGWRSYPATGAFTAADDVGTRGVKTFEVAVIPETKKTAMPEFAFSYFDPAAEKYVTLKSEARALTVTGAAPAPPPPVAATPSEAPPENKPPPPAPVDILGLHYQFGAAQDSSAPLYARRGFLLAQLVPLAAVLALLGRRVLRRSDGAREGEALRRERAELLRRLRAEGAHAEFFDAAARIVQLDTALATGRPASSVDAATACQSRRLDPETAEGIEAVFNARAELLYSGNAGDNARVPSDERNRVLRTIEKFSSTNGQA